jgi:hypothetical protein
LFGFFFACSDYYKTYTSGAFATAIRNLDNVNKYQGVCVECQDNCDCGLDEYCGFDYKDQYDKKGSTWNFEYKVTVPAGITSLNEGGGMPLNMKTQLKAHAKQLEGLPIQSKCKKYSTSHIKGKPKVCQNWLNKDAFAKMVEESLMTANKNQWLDTCAFKDDDGQQRKMVKRVPNFWPKDAQGA